MPSAFPRPLCRALVAALAALSLAPVAAVAADVVDRDAYSTTVDLGDGRQRTTLSADPINYQADSGAWHSIDTSLERQSDGTIHAQAIDGDLSIPHSLTQPVELEHDGGSASFRLLGASGAPDVDGNEATYDSALPGVDAQYSARPDGVKETLKLQSALSPRSFVYDLRARSTWSAAVEAGDVVLRDASGDVRYQLSAPLAWDSAADPQYTNALALRVMKVDDGEWRVTLTPSAAWLADPLREYPVYVDPDFTFANGTTHFHGAVDCYLSGNTQANNNFCAQSYLQTGYYNRPYTSLFKFDIASAIPSSATVSAATFKAYAPPASVKAAGGHTLRTVTSDWDANATWNNRKTSTPWTTAGGDVSTSASLTSASTPVQATSAWYSWAAPVAAVQGWVRGTLPNYGFQLSSDASAPTGNAWVWASTEASTSSSFPADSTQWPTLDVTWTQADTTPPAGIAVSGSLSTDNSNTAGSGTVSWGASATDAGSGVAKFELLDGSTVRATSTVACSAGYCGSTLSAALTAWSAGAHTLAIRVTDAAGNVATGTPWNVYVDRSGPVIPALPAPEPDDGDQIGLIVDAKLNETIADWPEADDAALPDGSGGSGVATYSVRTRPNSSAAWSSWATVEDSYYASPGLNSSLQVEVYATDLVGNAGATTSLTETPRVQSTQAISPTYAMPSMTPTFVRADQFDYWDNGTAADDPPIVATGSALIAQRATTDPPGVVYPDKDFHYDRTGAIDEQLRCKKNAWGPIQAKASLFVIGACKPNTPAHGFFAKTFPYHPGNPNSDPAKTEGRGWIASAFTGGNFKGCGWVSRYKRMSTGTSAANASPCAKRNRNFHDFVHPRVTTNDDDTDLTNSTKRPWLEIWSTITTDSDGNPQQETDGKDFTIKQGRACQAYGNINPWKKNQRAMDPITYPKAAGSATYKSGDTLDGTPFKVKINDIIRIRYLSKFPATDPDPTENWPDNNATPFWVMAHTKEEFAPWVWFSADCLFGPRSYDQ